MTTKNVSKEIEKTLEGGVEVKISEMTSEGKIDVSSVISTKETKTKDALDLASKLQSFMRRVKKGFVNMNDEFDMVMYALLTKEHLLFKGKPGIAKSAVIRGVINNIKGAKVFQKQLSKDMTPSALYGNINVKKLREEGVEEYNTKDSMVDADFVFLDEVYDANDMTLRSVLEILNERIFTKNGSVQDVPLHSCFMASNYKRDTEASEAFGDRIVYQREVKPLSKASDRKKMYQDHLAGTSGKVDVDDKHKVTIKEVKRLSEYVLNGVIKVSDDVLNHFDSILVEYNRQSGEYISPRKASKLLNVLKASALVKGRTDVDIDDLDNLKYGLVVGEGENEIKVFNSVKEKVLREAKQGIEEEKKLAEIRNKFEETYAFKGTSEDETKVYKIRTLNKLLNEAQAIRSTLAVESKQEELQKIADRAIGEVKSLRDALNI